MKANEAPEKLYVDTEDRLSDSILYGFTEKHKNDDIEYIRKDAFIEMACQFIEKHHHEFSFWNTEEYELEFSTQKFIEDFKKYMKGE